MSENGQSKLRRGGTKRKEFQLNGAESLIAKCDVCVANNRDETLF